MSNRTETLSTCVASIWHRGHRKLGKSYKLGTNRELEKGHTNTDAKRMRVAEFSDIRELAELIDQCHDGEAFLTSGTPRNEHIVEAPVSARAKAQTGDLTRTNDDLGLSDCEGTYFVNDYDPNPSDPNRLEATDLKQKLVEACAFAGADISALQMLSYSSSSSGFRRKSDGKDLGTGGLHLIFLVSNASDIPRFALAMFQFLVATGCGYGVVSKSGALLRRTPLDLAAVRPTQPTFVGTPAYKRTGLINIREETPYQILEGEQLLLRTEEIRNATEPEVANNERFWRTEEQRLSQEIAIAKREWFATQGESLRRENPDLSDAQIRRVLQHRQSGNLVAADVINLNGQLVSIAEILAEPEKFDGQVGPDPIEPDYRDGAYTAKLYINSLTGRPVIHSHAHGGIEYFVWHDTRSALELLRQLAREEALAALPFIIECTRPNDEVEVEAFLADCAKVLKVPKAALVKSYAQTLRANLRRTDTYGDTTDSYPPSIHDLAHNAAQTLINRLPFIHTDDSQIWLYNSVYHEPIPDIRAQQMLREVLTENGWDEHESLTSTTNSALAALKQLTHQPDPIIARDPKPILNFKNCELHFLADGSIEQCPHDPQSGLTSVIPVDYNPDATAPYFRRIVRRMFIDPAQERLKPRQLEQRRKYFREMLAQSQEMALHTEEVLAYFLVPARWLPRWFFWIGGGSNGKTLLTKILALLLSEEAMEVDRVQVLAEDFGLSRLIGKTIFIDDDLETDTTLPDGLIKKISEGKRLSANRKFLSSLTFWNRTALLVLANNYPRLIDVSAGTRRRVQSIEFPRRFYLPDEVGAMDSSQRMYAEHDLADIHAIEKIEAELPGVVNVLVAAYQRLIARGGFSNPDAVKVSNDKVIHFSNPLPMFIEHRCSTGKEFRFRTSEFYDAVMDWVYSEHLAWRPSRPQIRSMMGQLGWGPEKITKIKGHEHYVGIRLKGKREPSAHEQEFEFSPTNDDPLWDDNDDDPMWADS